MPLFCQEFQRTRSTVSPAWVKSERTRTFHVCRGLYQTTHLHEYCAYYWYAYLMTMYEDTVAFLRGWSARCRLLITSLAECAVSNRSTICLHSWMGDAPPQPLPSHMTILGLPATVQIMLWQRWGKKVWLSNSLLSSLTKPESVAAVGMNEATLTNAAGDQLCHPGAKEVTLWLHRCSGTDAKCHWSPKDVTFY